MADFNKVYARVLNTSEGGYANVKGDKGGETYKGISRINHPAWKGWPVIDAYKLAHKGIPRNFHIPDPSLDLLVKDFYYSEYWLKIRGNEIKNFDIASNLFDMSVNSGAGVKIMQDSLNQMGYKVSLDGSVGNNTLAAINKANPATLNSLYNAGRKAHYIHLVKEDPSQQKFYNGWIDRITHFATATGGNMAVFLLVGAAGLSYYFFFKPH